MRLAVYSDDPYLRANGSVGAVMPFALFLVALGEHTADFVLLGRVATDRGPAPVALPKDVSFVELPWWEDLSRPRQFARALPGTLRRFWNTLGAVDCVLLFGPSPVGLLFAALTRARRRRLVLGVRMDYVGYARHRHPGRKGLTSIARALDFSWRVLARRAPTVVVGSALAARYRRAPRLLDATIALTPEAAIADAGRPPPGRSGPVRVLTVGRIDAEKNPLLLADVLARLVADGDDWELVVCGDGPLRGALEHRLEALGVAHLADLRGFVAHSEGLQDLYRAADMLLHVSWTEGVPQVLSEAWASGLPVVATDVGGVRQASTPDAALLIPPGDAQAACDALRRVVADDDARAQLTHAGLDRARMHTREGESARVVAFLAAAGDAPRSAWTL